MIDTLASDRPRIRRLPAAAANRIAAGEVVERPASVVKELVENALDAGSTRIDVAIEAGGKTCITVNDDGCGLSREELPLALERHATSKLDVGEGGAVDLENVHFLGFRGEALPSIGAAARLTVESRIAGEDAWAATLEGGALDGPEPCAFSGRRGTRMVVADLFRFTPARLKFLKADGAEAAAVSETLKRLALTRADVGFSLTSSGRTVFQAPAEGALTADARLARLARILGEDFATDALLVEAERDGVRLTGFAALPTHNTGRPNAQHLVVNGRAVKDRLLSGALRAAYQDRMPRDRHPAAALFLDVPPAQVDVNVHPTKAEVRFREAGRVRSLVVGGLREALAQAGHRPSALGAGALKDAFRPGSSAGSGVAWRTGGTDGFGRAAPPRAMREGYESALWGAPHTQAREGVAAAPGAMDALAVPSARAEPAPHEDAGLVDRPLGAARAQLHENYIVAQTADGLILVDAHAAHERLVYEGMKTALAEAGPAPSQRLLAPEVVNLAPDEVARLKDASDALAKLGLDLAALGPDAVEVRAVPGFLKRLDAAALVRDVAADLAADDEGADGGGRLARRLDERLADMACRASVRTGRRLSVDEMNALLRAMEACPAAGQCNHGRPTYVALSLKDVERIFER